MNFIYCASYPSLKLVFYLISLKERVTIITYNRDILLLANDLGIPVKFLDVYMIAIPRVRQILNPFNILKFRNEMYGLFLKLSNEIKVGTFYFTVHCIDLPGLHFISLLVKNRKDINIKYWQDYKGDCGVKVMYILPLFKIAELIYVNLLYKPSLFYGKVADGKFIFATKYFLNKKEINIVEPADIWGTKIYKNINFDLVEKYIDSVVLLGDYSLKANFNVYTEQSVLSVFDFLKEHCVNLVYKQHPGPGDLDSYFSECVIAEKHIPSEILFTKSRLVIALATAGLSTLAKLGVTCVCLHYLVDPQPDYDSEFWVSKMTLESDGKIIFVKSREELLKYING